MLKILSNHGEHRVYEQIAPIADGYGAQIFRKIRVADVVDINKLRSELRSYALMAHFDFIVADGSHNPLFAIEFDGPGHLSNNDAKKDEICRTADIALFRVNLPTSRVQIGPISFLSYLVHFWFLGLKFEEMRLSGEVSYDEPFMISGFLRPDAKHIFDSEFDLLGPARSEISRYCKSENIARGQLSHLLIGQLLMHAKTGQYAAYCDFAIGKAKLFGRASLGLQISHSGRLTDIQFGKQELGQFCMAMAVRDLLEEIKLFHKGMEIALRRREDVAEEIHSLRQQGFSLLMALSSGDDELIRMAK